MCEELLTIGNYKEKLLSLSERQVEMMLDILPFGDPTAGDVFDVRTGERMLSINRSIFIPLNNSLDQYFKLKKENLDELVLVWTALGSAVESSLQLFLTAYKDNYDDNPFNRWERFDDDMVRNEISATCTELKNDSVITAKQRISINNHVKKFIKGKVNGESLENVSFNDLITYFDSNVWIGDKPTQGLDAIRKQRNVIHSFKDFEVEGWIEFEKLLGDYIKIMERLNDLISYRSEMVEEMKSEYV